MLADHPIYSRVRFGPALELPPAPPEATRRSRIAVLASLLLHVSVLLGLYLRVPSVAHSVKLAPEKVAWTDPLRYTQLVSPMFELAQRSPNRGQNAGSIDLEMLRPYRQLFAPRTIPKTVTDLPDPTSLAPPPPTDPNPGLPLGSMVQLPPQGSGGSRLPSGEPAFHTQAPSSVPFDIVPPSNTRRREPDAPTRPPRLILGDAAIPGGGDREAQRLPASPPTIGSSLELLTDARGADLEPYLARVVSELRHNWSRVPPDPHQAGPNGEASIQFAILRMGQVSGIAVLRSSLSPAMVSFALQGIEKANPLPPLPWAYHGTEIRVEVRFALLSARGGASR